MAACRESRPDGRDVPKVVYSVILLSTPTPRDDLNVLLLACALARMEILKTPNTGTTETRQKYGTKTLVFFMGKLDGIVRT